MNRFDSICHVDETSRVPSGNLSSFKIEVSIDLPADLSFVRRFVPPLSFQRGTDRCAPQCAHHFH